MILITGGTGFVGQKLTSQWIKEGRKIRLFALPSPNPASATDPRVEIRYGDISNENDVRGICEGISTVYHLAAVILSSDEGVFERINTNGTAHLVREARRAGVKHFVYVSSASVIYPKTTRYALSKKKAEDIVKASGLNYTIVRPTLVYSETGAEELNVYLQYLKKFPAVPFVGKGKAIKRPVYVDDVVAGLLAIHEKKITYSKTYNFSGAEPISILDFSRLCLKLMGQANKPIVRLPIWFCLLAAALMKFVMKNPPLRWQMIAGIEQDANLDPREAMEDLGYSPHAVSEMLSVRFKSR